MAQHYKTTGASLYFTGCKSDSQITGCNQAEVRLVGGQDKYEGRVEACHEGEWKTVCDRGWGREEAKVVCRQLYRIIL